MGATTEHFCAQCLIDGKRTPRLLGRARQFAGVISPNRATSQGSPCRSPRRANGPKHCSEIDMVATLGRVISGYRGLVETCQQRAVELGISRLEIDRLAGLTEGYSAKLLGNGNSSREKRMWPVGLEAILGALGLKILLIEDEAATARTLALRTPVVRSHQRFRNRSNAKLIPAASNEGEKINMSLDHPALAAPQRTDPPPVSRAHLRVVQTKSGRKFG